MNVFKPDVFHINVTSLIQQDDWHLSLFCLILSALITQSLVFQTFPFQVHTNVKMLFKAVCFTFFNGLLAKVSHMVNPGFKRWRNRLHHFMRKARYNCKGGIQGSGNLTPFWELLYSFCKHSPFYSIWSIIIVIIIIWLPRTWTGDAEMKDLADNKWFLRDSPHFSTISSKGAPPRGCQSHPFLQAPNSLKTFF